MGLPFAGALRASLRAVPLANTVPTALDVITPAVIAQSIELDPTLGPVVLQGLTIP